MTPAATHLVTTDAVAERLGCSLCTVRRMMADTARAGIAQPWVLVGTGLRIGQALGLAWSDVDLEAQTLRVRGELGKRRQERAGRTIPIAPALAEELAGWGTRESLIVGSPWVANVRKTQLRAIAACVDAGTVRAEAFDGQSCHAFRKAFVSELRRAGAPDDAVEYLVGHSAGVRAHYLDADALGLRGVVGMVAPVGAGRQETVVPLRRAKGEEWAT